MDWASARLPDQSWATIEAVLATLKSRRGKPSKLSDRRFVEAVVYLLRTGMPWRDLPAELAGWNAAYKRFRYWEARGFWAGLFASVAGPVFEGAPELFLDSTVVRAHQHAGGAKKNWAARRSRRWAARAAA
jgi:transposase